MKDRRGHLGKQPIHRAIKGLGERCRDPDAAKLQDFPFEWKRGFRDLMDIHGPGWHWLAGGSRKFILIKLLIRFLGGNFYV